MLAGGDGFLVVERYKKSEELFFISKSLNLKPKFLCVHGKISKNEGNFRNISANISL